MSLHSSLNSIKISEVKAMEITLSLYGISGKIKPLPGDSDFNFSIQNEEQHFVLKISRPGSDIKYLEFQKDLLNYLHDTNSKLETPTLQMDKKGKHISSFQDESGEIHIVRLLNWIDGKLWSQANPISHEMLYSLGKTAGTLTSLLIKFSHPYSKRMSEWDLAQSIWTKDHLGIFPREKADLIRYFLQHFESINEDYGKLRKSVVHNDANDNNVILNHDLIKPEVTSIIDFGDAIYTQTINDLAIAIAYAVMNKKDVLTASLPVIKGYHHAFPLLEKELEHLYCLVAMRLVTSVTKSTINSKKEADNKYHLISQQAAWEVLEKWRLIDPSLALYSFRDACGLDPVPQNESFRKWTLKNHRKVNDLFPQNKIEKLLQVDLGLESTLLGHRSEFEDPHEFDFKISKLRKFNNKVLIAGGYREIRPFYTTGAFKKEGNNGPEYRTAHLGIDFWIKAGTEIHSLFDARVFSVFNNDHDKDYGPTLILEHQYDSGKKFWTLYGHLSKSSLSLFEPGQEIKKGDLIAFVGEYHENGEWSPHLHFQIILDMLDYKTDFPGVSFPDKLNIWSGICPDPNLLFNEECLSSNSVKNDNDLIQFRKKHLGKSLSLSYNDPLHIVRGEGVYLIDKTGKKFLDTVNNVAHIGHEHARVVGAAKDQISILNTNTRYLHNNIELFAEALLKTLPRELSVVHFVNSGSEANELAIRMSKSYTSQQDMIAMEVGYHGNTNACMEISSYKFDGKAGIGAPENTHIVPLPDTFRGIYQDKDAAKKYASHVEMLLSKIRKNGRGVAGFIFESIISCGGQIELPDDFLKMAFNYVKNEGGVCIADEVQVGCGRIGSHFWGFEMHDVIPDIVTIGKPIGNGHPLAAVVCTKEIASAFANGMEYFNTFGGNPVSCAIGLEVLKVIKEEKLQENALKVGNSLKNKLKQMQAQFPIMGDVRGQGLFLGIELVDKDKTPLPHHAAYLINRMKDLGILMSTDGRQENVIKIKPPMVFSMENTNEVIDRLHVVLSDDYLNLIS